MVLPPGVSGCLCSSSSVWWTLNASCWWGSEIRSSRVGRGERGERVSHGGLPHHSTSQLFHLSVWEQHSSLRDEWLRSACSLMEIVSKSTFFLSVISFIPCLNSLLKIRDVLPIHYLSICTVLYVGTKVRASWWFVAKLWSNVNSKQ